MSKANRGSDRGSVLFVNYDGKLPYVRARQSPKIEHGSLHEAENTQY